MKTEWKSNSPLHVSALYNVAAIWWDLGERLGLTKECAPNQHPRPPEVGSPVVSVQKSKAGGMEFK